MEHLVQMAEQSETGYVGRARCAGLNHGLRGFFIQGLHVRRSNRYHFLRRPAGLDGRRDDADPERLRKHQPVPCFRSAFERQLPGMNDAGHRHAVFGLAIVYGMAANDAHPGLHRFIGPAPQDLGKNVHGAVLGKGREVQRRYRRCSHRVNIAQGICRRDCPEVIRVIDNGREKIDGLHNGHVIRDLIDPRVILRTDKNARVGDPGQRLEYLVQHRRTKLARSTRAVAH